MLALASAPQGLSPTLVVIVIAAVVVAVFWQTILRIGIAALIIGFMFLVVTDLLYVLHGLHALIH